jgi:hypothetical protein
LGTEYGVVLERLARHPVTLCENGIGVVFSVAFEPVGSKGSEAIIVIRNVVTRIFKIPMFFCLIIWPLL